jgi:hypothetical protein
MRLEGRSDVTYRAYDLLTADRKTMPLAHYLRMAGQYIPESGTAEPLTTLQRRFMSWGHRVLTHSEIETLLHEFWVWDRIKNRGKQNWPFRDPDDARRLYDENERAKAAAQRDI